MMAQQICFPEGINSHLNTSIYHMRKFVTALHGHFDVDSRTDLNRFSLAEDRSEIPLIDLSTPPGRWRNR